jgi:hypothetical protein
MLMHTQPTTLTCHGLNMNIVTVITNTLLSVLFYSYMQYGIEMISHPPMTIKSYYVIVFAHDLIMVSILFMSAPYFLEIASKLAYHSIDVACN